MHRNRRRSSFVWKNVQEGYHHPHIDIACHNGLISTRQLSDVQAQSTTFSVLLKYTHVQNHPRKVCTAVRCTTCTYNRTIQSAKAQELGNRRLEEKLDKSSELDVLIAHEAQGNLVPGGMIAPSM